MKNYVQPGEYVDLPAPAAVSSGDGLLVGMLFAVASKQAALNEVISCLTRGVCTLAKTTGQAWAIGDAIYWDNTGKKTIKTATANKFIGYATAVAASGDTVGEVYIWPSKDVLG